MQVKCSKNVLAWWMIKCAATEGIILLFQIPLQSSATVSSSLDSGLAESDHSKKKKGSKQLEGISRASKDFQWSLKALLWFFTWEPRNSKLIANQRTRRGTNTSSGSGYWRTSSDGARRTSRVKWIKAYSGWCSDVSVVLPRQCFASGRAGDNADPMGRHSSWPWWWCCWMCLGLTAVQLVRSLFVSSFAEFRPYKKSRLFIYSNSLKIPWGSFRIQADSKIIIYGFNQSLIVVIWMKYKLRVGNHSFMVVL